MPRHHAPGQERLGIYHGDTDLFRKCRLPTLLLRQKKMRRRAAKRSTLHSISRCSAPSCLSATAAPLHVPRQDALIVPLFRNAAELGPHSLRARPIAARTYDDHRGSRGYNGGAAPTDAGVSTGLGRAVRVAPGTGALN